VFGLFVPGSFDGPVAGSVAFDDPRVGAVSAFGSVGEDLAGDAVQCVTDAVMARGESPRSRRLRGG
jgi:hypothetical protein